MRFDLPQLTRVLTFTSTVGIWLIVGSAVYVLNSIKTADWQLVTVAGRDLETDAAKAEDVRAMRDKLVGESDKLRQELEQLTQQRAELQKQVEQTVTLLANFQKVREMQQQADQPVEKAAQRPRKPLAELARLRKQFKVNDASYVAVSFQELWELRDITPTLVGEGGIGDPPEKVFAPALSDGRAAILDVSIGEYTYTLLGLRGELFEQYHARLAGIHGDALPWKISESADDDKPEELAVTEKP